MRMPHQVERSHIDTQPDHRKLLLLLGFAIFPDRLSFFPFLRMSVVLWYSAGHSGYFT